LAGFLADRAKEEYAWAKNMLLLGEFNIYDTTDSTPKAITDAGFEIPEQLKGHPSNAQKSKHYDQIAFVVPELENRLELSEVGVFDFYEPVYRADDRDLYAEEMGEAYPPRKEDGTEHSDHLPMWLQLRTDFGEAFLKRKASMGA
jgi:hypothetical protein